jgi:hypothetical protein
LPTFDTHNPSRRSSSSLLDTSPPRKAGRKEGRKEGGAQDFVSCVSNNFTTTAAGENDVISTRQQYTNGAVLLTQLTIAIFDCEYSIAQSITTYSTGKNYLATEYV